MINCRQFISAGMVTSLAALERVIFGAVTAITMSSVFALASHAQGVGSIDNNIQEAENVIAFGDRFTTREMATELAEDLGLTYIMHYACEGRDCEQAPAPTQLPLQSNQDDDNALLEITGFHPKFGAVTAGVLDVSCSL